MPLIARSLLVKLAICLAVLGTTPLSAATYIVPADDQLIAASDAIVHGRVAFVQPMFADDGTIVTAATIDVVSVLKGEQAERVVVRDPGGIVGTRAMGVSGWSGYEAGETVLVFLERHGAELRTYGLALGKFNESTNGAGDLVFHRVNEIAGWGPDGAPQVERGRLALPFLAYIRSIVNGTERPDTPYIVEEESTTAAAGEPRMETTAHYPPSAYTAGRFRWARFDAGQTVTFLTSGSQPGYDSTGAAQRGLSAWTNEPNSNVVYAYGGTTSAGFVQDNINAIVFNSSTDVPSGAIGYARWFANAEHTYKGETFWSISEGDVVMRSNLSISAKAFDEAVTHELGHTLGFRHSNEATPSSSQAVMNSLVTGNFGAALAAWDVEAVTHVYTNPTTPPPPACTPPSISGQPQSRTVTRGQSTTLSVSAAGTAPLSYQWFSGTPESPSVIGGATSSSLTITPTFTATYFVRVSNGCGSADSAVVTVTVLAAAGARRVKSDFDGDGVADILFRHASSGQNLIWFMGGTTVRQKAWLPSFGDGNVLVEGVGDFDGDRKSDLMWHDYSSGSITVWLLDGAAVKAARVVTTVSNPNTKVGGTGDFDGDGRDDVVWRNDTTGRNQAWLMAGTSFSPFELPTLEGTDYDIEDVGDFDGDDRADILWRNYGNGQIFTWIMNGARVESQAVITTVTNTSTVVEGVGDADGDGREDILWRNYATGRNQLWLMNGATVSRFSQLPDVPDPDWRIAGMSDYNGDGVADVVWRAWHTGQNVIWFLSGGSVVSQPLIEPVPDTAWRIVAPQ